MNNWKHFCLALEEANNTEFYFETYPALKQRFEIQSCEEILECEVYKALESGLDPTDCLNDFLRTVLGSASRYSLEMGDIINQVIQMFLDRGAKFPYEKLFDKRYSENTNGQYDEDEIADYQVRGFIIDYLKPECAKQYADWSRIDAMYWEDIPAGVIGDYFRFSYLKHCSKYLQSL